MHDDLIIGYNEPKRYPGSLTNCSAIGAQLFGPNIVFQHVVKVGRLHLAIDQAMKLLGVPKRGFLVALPNFAWRTTFGADIDEG